MNASKVFISYSHSDREWARKFAETAANVGLQVWFDEFNVKPGQPIVDAIEKGLRESEVVVLLINADTVDRPNLFFEMGAALGMNKTIIPIVPAEFDYHKLPLPIQRIKFLVRKSPQETARELASAVESLYGKAA